MLVTKSFTVTFYGHVLIDVQARIEEKLNRIGNVVKQITDLFVITLSATWDLKEGRLVD